MEVRYDEKRDQTMRAFEACLVFFTAQNDGNLAKKKSLPARHLHKSHRLEEQQCASKAANRRALLDETKANTSTASPQ